VEVAQKQMGKQLKEIYDHLFLVEQKTY